MGLKPTRLIHTDPVRMRPELPQEFVAPSPLPSAPIAPTGPRCDCGSQLKPLACACPGCKCDEELCVRCDSKYTLEMKRNDGMCSRCYTRGCSFEESGCTEYAVTRSHLAALAAIKPKPSAVYATAERTPVMTPMNPRTHAEIARELAQDLRSSNPKLTEEQSLIEASRKLKTFSAGALGAVSTLSARELVANDPRTHAEKARAVALDMRAKDPRISEHDAILAASKLVHDIDRGAVNAATVGYLRAVSR